MAMVSINSISIEIIGATIIIIVAAVILYLAGSHQKLILRPLPKKSLLITGVSLLALVLYFLLQFMGSAISVFIVLTILMLVWSILPLIVVYFREER